MIYYSNHNNFKISGRSGNQIMRLMSLIGLSEKYNTDYAIPFWEYAKYFENEIPQIDGVRISQTVKEPHFHYCDTLLDGVNLRNKVIDLQGYFQSYKYWAEKLRFKKGYLMGLRRKWSVYKNPIAISVRRGDFVGNPQFYQLPVEYYTGALEENFPDYKFRVIYVFSDDLDFCRKAFSHIPNVVFVNAEPIEQLGLMNLCRSFIISQSTFSYVGAYLSDYEKVIRPLKNFDGEFAKKNLEKDFWPEDERWIVFDYEKQKV